MFSRSSFEPLGTHVAARAIKTYATSFFPAFSYSNALSLSALTEFNHLPEVSSFRNAAASREEERRLTPLRNIVCSSEFHVPLRERARRWLWAWRRCRTGEHKVTKVTMV